jgi:hypothetical protein
MTPTLEQRTAHAVIAADRQLHYAQRNLSLTRDLGDDDLIERAEETVTEASSVLSQAISAFAEVSDLSGIETEDGAVLRAFLIVAETVIADRDMREV